MNLKFKVLNGGKLPTRAHREKNRERINQWTRNRREKLQYAN